jgi:hypothetical protein
MTRGRNYQENATGLIADGSGINISRTSQILVFGFQKGVSRYLCEELPTSRLRARNSFRIASRSLGREPRSTVHGYDLLWWAITALVCLSWNRIPLQLAPIPSAGNTRAAAGTIQRPIICKAFHQRNQERPVTVRAAAKQISRTALGALDAVANTGSHGTCQIRQIC